MFSLVLLLKWFLVPVAFFFVCVKYTHTHPVCFFLYIYVCWARGRYRVQCWFATRLQCSARRRPFSKNESSMPTFKNWRIGNPTRLHIMISLPQFTIRRYHNYIYNPTLIHRLCRVTDVRASSRAELAFDQPIASLIFSMNVSVWRLTGLITRRNGEPH